MILLVPFTNFTVSWLILLYPQCTKIYSFVKGIKSEQQRAQNKIFNSGIKDGRRYIKDLEYKSLEKI